MNPRLKSQLEFVCVWTVMCISGLIILYYTLTAAIPAVAEAMHDWLMYG